MMMYYYHNHNMFSSLASSNIYVQPISVKSRVLSHDDNLERAFIILVSMTNTQVGKKKGQ